MHWFTDSIIHSLLYSLTHLLALTDSFTDSLTHSCTGSLTRALVHWGTDSCTHSLAGSRTHRLTGSRTILTLSTALKASDCSTCSSHPNKLNACHKNANHLLQMSQMVRIALLAQVCLLLVTRSSGQDLVTNSIASATVNADCRPTVSQSGQWHHIHGS